jgi:nucleoside-diphosphate-sugar epimerase
MAPVSFSGRRVLVTGGSGFLGSRLVAEAFASGASVTAAVRTGTRSDRLGGAPKGAAVVPFDLSNFDDVSRLVRAQAPDILIHAAAYGVDPSRQDPQAAFAVNVLGTWNVLRACAEVRVERFIHLGSCSEYGPKEAPLSEDDPLRPISVYGASKGAASVLAAAMSRAMGVRAVVLRLFGIWGPGEGPGRLVPQIIRACLEKNRLSLTEGLQVRDFSYVDDVADRILRVAVHPDFDRFPVVNVGGGRGRTVREFSEEAAEALGGRDLLDFGALPYRPNEYRRLVADVSRLAGLLGPLPATPLREGVLRMKAALPATNP